MKRGDVFWADLAPRSGSEQSGRRPVAVVSHNGFNQAPNWRSIIVVPISTSKSQIRRGLTIVPLPKGIAAMPQASVALCHQVTTLDRSKLIKQIGTLPPNVLNEVEQGLKAAMDLDSIVNDIRRRSGICRFIAAGVQRVSSWRRALR